jgi:SAM-dependent methyltransferase
MIPEKSYPPFPTEDHDAMAIALDIKSGDRVLDVGGGHQPFARADVIVDIDFDSSLDRDGLPGSINLALHKFVKADICALPFKDNAFDVSICIHVLEHLNDPAKACNELMRVAGRGYIETPSRSTEYFAGHPTHKWLIDDRDNVLFFEPIPYAVSPYLNVVWPLVWNSPDLFNMAGVVHRDISCVQFAWKNNFQYRVKQSLVKICSSNSSEALAARHYAFARNLLYWAVPPGHGLYHAKHAAELSPDNRIYCELYSFYLALSGKWRMAVKHGFPLKLFFYAVWGIFMIKFSQKMKNWYKLINGVFPIK